MTLRLEKGSPLTPLEMDDNLRILRDFDNGLEALVNSSLNPDGSLKDGAVDREAVLVDRVVTQRKLSFTSAFFAVATGAANAYLAAFTPALSGGYAEGMVFWIKANFTNTGPATLNVDSQGAIAITKVHDMPLVAGDIESDQIVALAYDSTGPYFQIVSTLPTPTDVGLGTSLQLLRTNSGGTAREWFTASFMGSAQAIGAGPMLSWAHGFSKKPDVLQVNLRCVDAAGNLGYAQNDEVDVAEAQGNGDNAWATVMVNATDIALVYDGGTIVQIRNKGTGALGNIDKTKWNVIANAHLLS